jgi:hypothetical protein
MGAWWIVEQELARIGPTEGKKAKAKMSAGNLGGLF